MSSSGEGCGEGYSLKAESVHSKDLIVDFKHDSSDMSIYTMNEPQWSNLSEDEPNDFRKAPHDHSSHNIQETPEEIGIVFKDLEAEVLTFVKEKLKEFCSILSCKGVPDDSKYSESKEKEQSCTEPFLTMILEILKRMGHQNLAESLQSRWCMQSCRSKLKRRLHQKFSCWYEGVPKAGKPIHLNQIFTELHTTEIEASEDFQMHEVKQIEDAWKQMTEPTIECKDIFKRFGSTSKGLKEVPVRTVLTKGIAGIGKTVLTRKFCLDWAEGRANQDIQLVFPFTFRELNVLKDRQLSLMELMHFFFSESEKLINIENVQVHFIFDGLDECRFTLDFSATRDLTKPTESASIDVLLVNLIRGSLLPSACLWVTTRPGAANQIPAEFISSVKEVRGFSHDQKEQYFRKALKDEEQVTTIISFIKSIPSLDMMSNIPIFCWILSTALKKVLKMKEKEKLPQTITQMYISFLVVQVKVKNMKYDGCTETDQPWTPGTKQMIWSLGKLAFEQLEKGNLIFYESDLGECGLDATEIACYSGVFNEVLREESGLYQDKVYSFIHLSIQEFLAALHVHETFFSSGVNLLSPTTLAGSVCSEVAFYCSAVDRALQSTNGHLDLFLRFLLGLSLSTNQKLLTRLLTESKLNSTKETVEHLKMRLNQGLSAEKSLNLCYCLKELNDTTFVENIRWYQKRQFTKRTSPAEWSGLAFHLLSFHSSTDDFDLRNFYPSENALLGLLPVVKTSVKAILCCSDLSPNSCPLLASVLSSNSLTHLDLSNNDLKDSGVEQLCSGLKSIPCALKSLRLSGCLITERGGASLISALRSPLSFLTELDLSYNNLGTSVDHLTNLWVHLQCPLDSLRLLPAGEKWMKPGLGKYFCAPLPDSNTASHQLKLFNQWGVRHMNEDVSYSKHRDGFDFCPQVLCSTGLTGSCYWEVNWSGSLVYIAVSYKAISRKDQCNCLFGDNERSWNMRISDGQYSFRHNGSRGGAEYLRSSSKSSHLSEFSGRVGVFLDTVAGFLTFYEVCSDGELLHLHTFRSSFTEPLFPGFGLWHGSSVHVASKHTGSAE